MKLTVITESRFVTLPDGSNWAVSSWAADSFWTRYTQHFDQILVLARSKPVDEPPAGATRLAHPDVRLLPLPHYLGPTEMMRQLPGLVSAVRKHVQQPMAYILRVPGWLGLLAGRVASTRNLPYAIEVVSDPFDVFGPGASRHPARAAFRWYFSRALRRQCQKAFAVSYVTEQALQQRYPPKATSFTTNYSSIELPSSAFLAAEPDLAPAAAEPIRIVSVGTMGHLYKAQDLLIDALAINIDAGMKLELSFVGDGSYRQELEQRAQDLGIGGHIRFLGQVTHDEVFRIVDGADLFVLPSRQEGLPRAMIEAMARGKPCIGSTVGGIPELLEENDMVPPNDTRALADKIRDVANDRDRLRQMASRNLEKSRFYASEQLIPRRNEFYSFVKSFTEDHYSKMNLSV
ncbi:MAG: glycosyltransferase [Geminicoccaceae bacterium]